MIILYVLFGILVFLVIFHLLTKKFLNPYKLTMVFGKKGSGKSTMLTALALSALKKGISVYSTESIPGCYLINASKDIGTWDIPENSLVLIDEVGMIWDNRKFKTFPDAVRDWFKLQRHRRLTVYLFSQAFDVDLKIRDVTDDMYLIRKYFRVFAVARKIDKVIVLNNSTAEAPSSIAENLSFVPIVLPGALRVFYIPKYISSFDSFVTPALPHKDFPYIPLLYEKEEAP